VFCLAKRSSNELSRVRPMYILFQKGSLRKLKILDVSQEIQIDDWLLNFENGIDLCEALLRVRQNSVDLTEVCGSRFQKVAQLLQ